MTEIYEKDGRKQYRTYCSTCKVLLDDTAPMQRHLNKDILISNTCPECGGKINDPKKDQPKK